MRGNKSTYIVRVDRPKESDNEHDVPTPTRKLACEYIYIYLLGLLQSHIIQRNQNGANKIGKFHNEVILRLF